MEHLKKYPRTLHLPWSPGATSDDKFIKDLSAWEGRDIVITEKMDGECLAASTLITMADGSRRRIRDLVVSNSVGEMVLGYDDFGRIVPTPIQRVYNNGSAPAEEWYKIRLNGSNGFGKDIYCTAKELFYIDDEYRPVTDLKPGDKVKFHKRCLSLTAQQEQVMLGALLGDASLHFHHDNTALLQMSHKIAHADYTKWLMATLGVYSSGEALPMVSGYGTSVQKNWTRCTRAIYDKFNFLYKSGAKQVTSEIVDRMGPLALAVWYMDDGSRLSHPSQKDRVSFATCGFTRESCENLRLALSKFGLKSSLVKSKGYYQINLNTSSSERFFSIIERFIPTIMRYKLPIELQGFSPSYIISDDIGECFDYLIESKIISIENKAHRVERVKYDLQTGTSNFFANSVLVHNCTTMYNNHIHARSLDSKNHESRNLVKGIWGEIRHNIPEGWRVCGENLYAKHSIAYDNLESYFMVFSIWNQENICLTWDETLEYSILLNLTPVKVLYRGPFELGFIKDFHLKLNLDYQEGFVIRSAASFYYDDFQSNVVKWVRKDHVTSGQHWMFEKIIPNTLKQKT